MTYDDRDIQVLRFPESVRKRARLHCAHPNGLVLGIVENAIDEATLGYGQSVIVTLDGGTATVEDHGRGIPVVSPTFGGTPEQRDNARGKYGDASALELVFTIEPGQGPNRIA